MKHAKKSILIFICVLSLFTTVFTGTSMAAVSRMAETEKVIRVDFPLFEGFSEKDENGNLSGYNYEFLMKIAQRTGWTYEFDAYEPTNENLKAGMDKVKNGESDLILSFVQNDALTETYEYASVPYGKSNFVLLTAENNQALNERTYKTIPTLRVALIDGVRVQNEQFKEFAEKQGLFLEEIYATNVTECKKLVLEGKADVLIDKDVVNNEGFKTVIEFNSQPFYFATSKNNTQLAEQLSQMITEINETDPYYMSNLHDKYFKYESNSQLSLTSDELDYIKDASTIRAIILKEHDPVEEYNPKTGEFSGIVVDIMREISEQIGIPIQFIPADSMAQARTMLENSEADIFAGFPYDYQTAEDYNLLLSSSVLTMPVARITNRNQKAKQDGVLVSASIRNYPLEKDGIYIEDLKQILNKINKGEYGSGYVNGYIAQHYMEENAYPNLVLTQTPFSDYEVCIGVHKRTDIRLMGILEQVIAKLQPSQMEDIIYQNTVHSRPSSFFSFIKNNPLEFLVPALILSAIIIGILITLFLNSRRLTKQVAEEKNKYQEFASLDLLSHTYNNNTFKKLAKDHLDSQNSCGTLIICDIDEFKSINDTYGHLMGDNAILTLGKLMTELFRDEDIVGRLGGDEFVVLMKGTTNRDVIEKRCQELLNKSKNVINECEITLSVGGTIFTESAEFDTLLKSADDAMYDVKGHGKNAFKIVSYKK